MGRVNWRQAWGEALLIVAGVVLALGAEAWWSAQSERAQEQEYLEALAAELGSLKSYAQSVMDQAKTIEAAGRGLLTISDTWPTDGVGRDSVAVLIAELGNEVEWSPPLTVYQDLINTGSVRTIRSEQVRQGLTEVMAAAEWVEGRVDRHNQFFWDHLEPFLRRQLPVLAVWPYEELPAPSTSWTPDGFISNLEFVNLVAAKSMTALDVWEGADGLNEVIDRVVQVIADESADTAR
jgi:hypothetical protein